jgi:hypothetical protein
MELRRLRAGEWILAASGGALFGSLFLPWYGAAGTLSAWESFTVVDLILAVIAAAAVAVLVVTATQSVPAVPIMLESLVTIAGIVATVLVLIKVLALPAGTDAREWAIWLGLAGAVGIAAGGLVAMRDERLSPAGRHTDHTGLPARPPGDIETLPAPGRDGTT